MRRLIPLLLSGCFSNHAPSGELCAAAPPVCPPGQICVTGTCYRPVDVPDLGVLPDLAEPVDGSSDLPIVAEASGATSTINVSSMTAVADGQSTITVTVTVKDASSNVLPAKSVTLSSSGTNVFSPQGAQLSDAMGQARWLMTSTVAEAKMLTAAVDALTLHANVTFTPGAAALIDYTAQPVNAAPAPAQLSTVRVRVEDQYHNLVDNVAVSLDFATNPNGATLGGTKSSGTVGGIASFSDLTVDKTGSGYKLLASSGSLTPATSDAFDIIGGLPTVPTNLVAAAAVPPPGALLTWTASTGTGPITYHIFRSTQSMTGYTEITSTSATAYTDSGATDGTYYYVIQASNSAGSTGNSNEASITLGKRICVTAVGTTSVLSFIASSNGTVNPLTAINGAMTTIAQPFGLGADLVNNEIAVSNTSTNTVTIFGNTDTGNVAPKRTITGLQSPYGVAIDTTHNEIIVSNFNNASITVYSRTASGAATPTRTIAGATTTLSGPEDLKLDLVNDEIVVVDFSNKAVFAFNRTDNGNVAPKRTLFGVATLLTTPVGGAIDTVNDNLFVVNSGGNSLNVYARTASGNTAPVRTLAGGLTGLSTPAGVEVDTVTNQLYVANYNGGSPSSITVYPRTASGNTPPSRTISNSGMAGSYGVVICKP